ncbi:MAG: AAA family ATPase, partial [Coriobacteriales bacterium]|nr:AAA family ATPase [Coriobacteriales bacterium]
MIRGRRDKIDLSSSVFRDFIEQGLLYVDKSTFIEHVLEEASRVLLITRPRRMGKSLNLDMLRSFMDVKQDSVADGLFEGLAIENSPCLEQANSVPVV